MAKYRPIEMVKDYQGKICQHSDTYFQRRGKDKTVLCTGKICNPRDLSKDPFSANEVAAQEKFAQAVAAVKALTPEQKSAYKASFEKQSKYQFLMGYMIAQEYSKLA